MDYDRFNDNAYEMQKRKRISEKARKQRRKKLLKRRILIVLVCVLILSLIIFLLVSLAKAIFKSDKKAVATDNQATSISETNQNSSENVKAVSNQAFEFKVPNIPDDSKSEGHYSASNGGVYIYDKMAFELFGGSEDSAQYYADAISSFKKSVGDEVRVYNMIVPNHTEFGLPRRLIENSKVSTQIQADNIKEIYSRYSEDVIPINCYNNLSDHVDEYIYFNTDHHWTGLGAYYAYSAFCEQTDQRTLDLSVCTEHTIDGFEGTLLDNDESLKDNLDTVHFWTFPYETYAMRTVEMGQEPEKTTVYYEQEGSGPYAYGAFIWGDSPLFVEYNTEIDNDKKIAVVKESYGNAFVPYLTADYSEVHVIDFRYFSGSLKDYCSKNDIDEVLFINNVMAANTAMQVDRITSIF